MKISLIGKMIGVKALDHEPDRWRNKSLLRAITDFAGNPSKKATQTSTISNAEPELESVMEAKTQVEENPEIKEPAEISSSKKIVILSILFLVIIAVTGIILHFRKEPTTPPKKFTNSIGMEFMLIPEGTFRMGSSTSPEETFQKYGGTTTMFKTEHPQHPVELKKSFYIQVTEVTQGQWKKVMGEK